MKKLNKNKSAVLFMISIVLGMTVIAFQNFTPHDPFKTNDVSDLYMNSALSTALKTKETKGSSQQVAMNKGSGSDTNIETKESHLEIDSENNDPEHALESEY
ncbi:MAG: hypothetical protein IT287_04475 [Bdellovibrionaceae bacterium]|nr:hypothetical protein [Pseudobdellovibrionaceae bacterium]